MKISKNWLKDYIDIQDSTDEISKKLTFGGLEVEGVETFETIPGGLKGIVIGEVLTCEKHPNADKLSITTVNIGDGDAKPIVCGASNVAKGQKVLVATVGSVIHPLKGEAFEIRKAKIRGEISEGMICAEDELGLGENHDGIMVLTTDLPNGTPAIDYFLSYEDETFEIGLTPNRGDAASHLGVARDLKALYKKDLKSFIPDKWPSSSDFLKIEVELKNPEACHRYAGIVIRDLEIKESPEWLRNKLKSIGLKPINNVVDVTNYILQDLGQPLHAFDYDKIRGQKVVVQTGMTNQKFKTLDEVERTLDKEDLMICDASGPMCIGGVFGGINSGVSASTKSIFLESACFDPVFIRKTSQRHGLKTDAAFRFERGTDIDQVLDALKKACALLSEVANGKIASEVIDIYPIKKKEKEISLRKSDIERLIGIPIKEQVVIEILKFLDIDLVSSTQTTWNFKIPNYRVEVTRPADLIEEILRIYGFNNVPLDSNAGSEYLAQHEKNDPYAMEEIISDLLVSRNLNEIQTNSLGNPEHSISKQGPDGKAVVVEILNKLSEELGVMRDNLLPSMLEVLKHNINRKQTNLRLFEFGFIYTQIENGYREKRNLAIGLTGLSNEESWLNKNLEQDFFELKSILSSIFQRLGINDIQIIPVSIPHYHTGGFEIKKGNRRIGLMGELNKVVIKKFEINQRVFFAELNIEELLNSKNEENLFQEITKFPEVRRDLSLVIKKHVKYDDIIAIARKEGGKLIKEIRVFDVFEGKPLEDDQKSYAMSFILEDKEKTLEDQRIDKLMTSLINKYEKELEAVIRR